MANRASRTSGLTVDEYLLHEETAEVRHEYVAGEIYAMTGGTIRHNRIALNIASRLQVASAGGSCEAFINDMKVRASPSAFYYPDVVVACGAQDDSAVAVSEPCLIVEVTSPSSLRIDRHEKLRAYQAIASLRAYLIVHQDHRVVEHHWRGDDGLWQRALRTDTDTIALSCPACVLSLDEIYARVELPAADEHLRLREGDAVYG